MDSAQRQHLNIIAVKTKIGNFVVVGVVSYGYGCGGDVSLMERWMDGPLETHSSVVTIWRPPTRQHKTRGMNTVREQWFIELRRLSNTPFTLFWTSTLLCGAEHEQFKPHPAFPSLVGGSGRVIQYH